MSEQAWQRAKEIVTAWVEKGYFGSRDAQPNSNAVDLLQRLLAALPPDSGRGGWRPIETMPTKDWVMLWLVTQPDPRNSGVVMGQKAQADEHEGMFWDGHIYRPLKWCTHWQPQDLLGDQRKCVGVGVAFDPFPFGDQERPGAAPAPSARDPFGFRDFYVGQPVEVTDNFKYGEWRGVPLWVCGIQHGGDGFPNIAVSEHWPPEGHGDHTDGFAIEHLRPRALTAVNPGCVICGRPIAQSAVWVGGEGPYHIDCYTKPGKDNLATLRAQLAAVELERDEFKARCDRFDAIINKAPLGAYADKSHIEIAGMVRMLTRNDLDHEFVCTAARDRIVLLVEAVASAEARAKQAERERAECENTIVGLRRLNRAYKNRAEQAETALAGAVEDKDEAYRQRNHLVAALARLFPSGVRPTNIEGWSPDWHGCVYIDLPSGQISYHYHDSQAHLFDGLPPYNKPWDGHDKETVHARLASLPESAQRVRADIRAKALEEAAKVADEFGGGGYHPDFQDAGERIAKAIRALAALPQKETPHAS